MRAMSVVRTCAFALAASCAAGVSYAQSPMNNSVFFTFSQPVTLPQVTLPAGRYLFQLADSVTNRQIVQVYSEDRSKLFGMMMTIPTQRTDTPNRAELRFMESPANMAPAIRNWWYPGTKVGWEFVYPKSQAMQLAKTAKEPVLTTAQATTTEDQMRSADLERVNATGAETPVTPEANPAPMAVSGTAQPGQIAQNSTSSSSSTTSSTTTTPGAGSTVSSSSRTSMNTSARAVTTRTRLPKTASDTPLFALLGVLALGLGMAVWPRRVATAAVR